MTMENPELQLAFDFVQQTHHTIFLTGKAGTGKTTFLKKLKALSPKRMIVTAPTGVAAINAGGVTLHSFFQMPFGPFLPGNEDEPPAGHRRFNREKINIIKSLDLLVIDEISMVRADLLDGIDVVLRFYKNRHLPFGGVQLLMIGDLHQLSPVVKKDEWNLLKDHYDSCYFFDSHALQQTEKITIELKHIYRQSEPQFIALLNRVRDNRLDDSTLRELNSRYKPDYQPDEKKNDIRLCTHNRQADTLNKAQLNGIQSKAYTFEARIEGDYPESTYPTPKDLQLKLDAQVMFVRNDVSPQKRYFNGKIGKISQISNDKITVRCPDDVDDIIVEQVTWENIRYVINRENKEICEEIIGTFHQYPLRLAWAITIHKSQGLTFDRAIIDANAAFAHGQVYVALSRCKTFEGVILSEAIRPKAVKTDEKVGHFSRQNRENPPTQDQLEHAKILHQQKLLQDCFSFENLRDDFADLIRLLEENRSLLHFSGFETLPELERQVFDDVISVSGNFKRQLQKLYDNKQRPEEDATLQERVGKASHYFLEKLEQNLSVWLASNTFETDNKAVKKRMKQAFDCLGQTLFLKLACMKSCQKQFSVRQYQEAVATAGIQFEALESTKKRKKNRSEANIEHEQLFQILKEWRTKQSIEEDVAPFRILYQKILIQIVTDLPQNIPALKKINGVGKRLAEKYGDELIAIVVDYCLKNNIPLEVTQATQNHGESKNKRKVTTKQKEEKIDTKKVSLDLYAGGKNIDEIAKERGLVSITIEGHLAHYVGLGMLSVTELLDEEKIKTIKAKIAERGLASIRRLKVELGNEYSYGEIKIVMKYLDFEKSSNEESEPLLSKVIGRVKQFFVFRE